MTQYPEATLARELGMCFCGLLLVTDYDTGVEGVADIEAMTMDALWAVLGSMVATVRHVLPAVVERVPAERACACGASVVPDPPA